MFPGMGGMNPANMKKMMQQLGIKSEEINAKRVVFELEGKRLVIENPSIQAITMQGQKTYTVNGEAREEKGELEIPEDDVKLVMEQAKCPKAEAEKVLKETNGDIAEAITRLKK